MNKAKTLASLSPGESGIVADIFAPPAMKERFLDLGLIPKTTVLCTAQSYSRDICVYEIRGASIAIRDCDAAYITLEKEKSNG